MYFWGNHINGIENFWGLCKVRLAKFRGFHKHKFYYHIKGGEFRYNNRNKSLYICLMKIIKKITPLRCLEPNKLTTPCNFPSLETTKYLNTMKKTRKHLPFYLLLLVLVWASSFVQAQSQSDTTYTGNITVTTQEQVNALRSTLAGKTRIDGNLTIGYHDWYINRYRGYTNLYNSRIDITDLSPLGSIVRITGSFYVNNNDSLTDLGSFPVLQSIGGYFKIYDNDKLTDVGDFPVLDSIGGYFEVRRNFQLTDLGDFPILKSIGGNFNVTLNYQLTNLVWFPSLRSIGGYFKVSNNWKLTDLGDFPILKSIGGYFNVTLNYQLTNLVWFPSLRSIGGYFNVNDNRELTDLGDFPVLKSIGGNFRVTNNDTLTILGNFPVLTSIGIGSAYVPSLGRSSLGRYTYIRNVSIVVERNPNLVLCSWLEKFIPTGTNAVTGRIYINNNASGCNSTEEINDPPPILIVTTNKNRQIAYNSTNPIPITFTVGGGATGWTSKITYTPADANFITRSSSEGTDQTGAVTIMATPMENTGIDERTATITLTTTGIGTPITQMVVIRQKAKRLMVTTNKNHQITYNSTDPIPITFTVGGGATGWTSEITYTPVDANFITRSPTRGTDITGAITLMATPTVNTGVERTATITLTTTGIGTPATQMIVIRQEANITISRETLIVTTNKNHQIAYNSTNPIPITFTVGGGAAGWASAITYAPADANFITLSPTRGTDQTGAVTITATPTVNTGVERTATITLTTTGIGTPVTQMIVIRQGEANITISRETLIVTTNKNHQIAYDNIDPISVSFTIGGGATGWTSAITYTPANADFITLSSTEGTDITGAITLMATPTVNTGVERTATITLTTTGIGTPATQMIVIRQGEANITISRETLIVTTNKNHQIAYDNIDPISVSFTIGGGATGWTSAITYAPANASFIALSPTRGTDQTGAITLMATPTVNTGVERTATITLTTTGIIGTVPVVQTIVIGQEANPTTLSTHAKESLFALYPNPTESTLTIKGVTGYLQMYIYDLVGREVMTYSLTPSKKTIDVSDLLSGMYVVTLQGEEQTWTEVLIIVN